MTLENKIVPFLQPHEINWIRKRLLTLIGAFYFSGDNRVLNATKSSTLDNILEHFAGASPEQRKLLEEAIDVRDKEELTLYMNKLAPYVIPFPKITSAEIKKLFPKVKKLVVPDLEALDYTKLSYLGWRDIATNSLYMVHHVDGKWVGTECNYVLGPKNRSIHCKWCNQSRPGDEAALVTSQVKSKTITDGYKSIGNHLCIDSQRCNEKLTSKADMEAFLVSLRRR